MKRKYYLVRRTTTKNSISSMLIIRVVHGNCTELEDASFV